MPGTVAGPSGGYGGETFSDLTSAPDGVGIAAVEVRAGAVIDAIRFVYRHGQQEVAAPWHGGGGGQSHRLSLAPDEFITEVRGAAGLTPRGYVVQSLSISTNKRERPWRVGAGGVRSFIYEAGRGHEIGGLTGASGSILDAIGVLLRPQPLALGDALFRNGPTGGDGGNRFSDARFLEQTPGLRVSRVTIRGDRFVDSIAVDYLSPSGQLIGGATHGGGGGQEHRLMLEPGEYITAISGLFGTLVDRIVVDTNRRERALAVGANFRFLEPRGLPSGFYRYEAPADAEIAGFFGRCGTYVDALGVIMRVRTA